MGMSYPPLTRGHSVGLVLAFAVLISGCGISLSAENTASEIFVELTVQGDFAVGGQLALSLAYEQPYPVPITVVCAVLGPLSDDEEPEELARILSEALPANPEGGPLDQATPVADAIQRSFSAPDSPGRYLVRCRTEADEDNAIIEEITIKAAQTPVP